MRYLITIYNLDFMESQMEKVFISGSISTRHLPSLVEDSLKKIIQSGLHILVGDAKGIDEQVQKLCYKEGYSNITIYSIYEVPRLKVDTQTSQRHVEPNFKSKRERERQQAKDKAMTLDSDFSFVIWDGKSKGSYANILRALEKTKKIKIYLTKEGCFWKQDKLNDIEITYYYRDKNGYSASEIVDELAKHCSFDYSEKSFTDRFFKDTRSLNKYLLKTGIIKKEKVEGSDRKTIYLPTNEYAELFIIDEYRGQAKGIKFKNKFIDWIEKHVKNAPLPEQGGFAF